MVTENASMIASETMTDAEFDRIAFDVLRRELGADGLARFIRLHRSGTGDYTAGRMEWQQSIALDDVAASIGSRRKKIG